MKKIVLGFLAIALFLCTPLLIEKKDTLKVAASAVPHAEMLAFVVPTLLAQGIQLEILEVDDYNIPNRSLNDGEIAANFFQHIPFLEDQIEKFHYDIAAFAEIHIEPMGLYSKKHEAKIPKTGSIVSIPNDPTNEGRALHLLHDNNWIELDNPANFCPTTYNIKSNPYQLQFREVDAPLIPRTLLDVDYAIMNVNFALQAQLSPTKDALFRESPKNNPYVNIIAVRRACLDDPALIALKKAMTSPEMRTFIETRYQGEILPAF